MLLALPAINLSCMLSFPALGVCLRFTSTNAARKVLRTMRVSEAQLALVRRPAVLRLAELFTRHNHELRVAGGAVRDLLSGLAPHDLDFATTATPEEMKKMFEEEGVRMINETGEKHGTITARIDEENFECTTLRIDLRTDGRRAEVQFTKDWYLDANRRDLTINSMFLDLNGVVYDYFDGKRHLEENKVEFVGNPDDRIIEDYLRILRYFRFYGRIANDCTSHSEAVLKSITKNAAGLSKISGERIWSELQKIVVGAFGGELLRTMVQCKLGPPMGLPEDYDGNECVKALERCQACGVNTSALQPITVMAGGFRCPDDALNFIARIKCSRRERELLLFIVKHIAAAVSASSVKLVQDLLAQLVIQEKTAEYVARERVKELLQYACQVDHLRELEAWVLPTFPIRGGDLVGKLEDKKKTRLVTNELFILWRDSDFSLTSEELLESVGEIQTHLKSRLS